MKTFNRNDGFTLIEMLITVVIISVGILGVAAMQTLGVRYTQNSYMLSIATQQAQDMAERIRSNPAEMVDTTSGGYYNNISGSFSGTKPDCITATCTSEQRAQVDHAEWSGTNSTLFGDTGSVSRINNSFQITINWNDIESSGTAAKSFTLNFLP
jgi:type IV pilus assembly protein PilV